MSKHAIKVIVPPGTKNIQCPGNSNGLHGDYFVWTCPQGDLKIELTGNSPFDNGSVFQAIAGKPTPAAHVSPSAHGTFKYDVHVTLKNGEECTPLDPHIIIDESYWQDRSWSWLADVGLMAAGAAMFFVGWTRLKTRKRVPELPKAR